MLAKAGSPVSVSPGTELRMGYGITKIGEFLNAGVPLGVSMDNTVLAGDANMFGLLKMVRNIENGKSHDEFKMSARRALELGTIDGARSIGMDARIGSLKPGKRADVIMVATQTLNMGVFTDPAHMLVESAQADNVTPSSWTAHSEARRQAYGPWWSSRCSTTPKLRSRRRAEAGELALRFRRAWTRMTESYTISQWPGILNRGLGFVILFSIWLDWPAPAPRQFQPRAFREVHLRSILRWCWCRSMRRPRLERRSRI
jgi:hypothetical protein